MPITNDDLLIDYEITYKYDVTLEDAEEVIANAIAETELLDMLKMNSVALATFDIDEIILIFVAITVEF